jgi:fatty-acyl-CoA synthase
VACQDPLFVRDEQARTYLPYSLEALRRAGLQPCEGVRHD